MPASHDFTPAEKTAPDLEASTANDDSQWPFEPKIIRDQVARILTSPEFEKSFQLGRFLEYVVEETLAGRGDRIKQYTVAVNAFGRPSHFDPRVDPIVRIEARRLRRSLNRYYQLYGDEDPIIIDIPTGAYVPQFRWNERAEAHDNETPDSGQGLRPAATVPTLALLPFEALLSDDEQRFFADSLGEELAIALHRFHHLHVIGPTPRESAADDAADLRSVARRYHADFLFGGRVLKAGEKVKIVARLLDGLSGKLLWSETYASQADRDPYEFGEEVIYRIAATLLDPYGVIPRMFLRRAIQLPEDDFRVYQALLEYSRYLMGNMGHHAGEAIHALEAAVDIAPNNALIKALLADLYVMTYQYGADKAFLAQGEALAREALRLDPQCYFAHFVMAFAPYAHGQRESFIRQMRKAVRFNPYNPVVLAAAGLHLGVVGEWEEGFTLIRQAIKLNPNYPGWYHTLAFLDAYRHSRFEEALELARQFNTPTFFWDPLARAATLGQLGRSEEAQAALQELLKLVPNFMACGRELMTRALFTQELVEMLLEGLYKAGLDHTAQPGAAIFTATDTHNPPRTP